MSREMPSMIALLGLLAVAGYQNRDKLADMFGGQKEEPGGSLATAELQDSQFATSREY